MTDKPIHVLLTKPFSDEWIAELQKVSAQLVITSYVTDVADDIPDELWQQTEILYTWSAFPTLEKAPNLRWVQLDTSGADKALASPLKDSDILITSITGVAPSNMAEHAFLMMLAFGHRLPLMLDLQGRHDWTDLDFRWNNFTPQELRRSTVAVVGYGSIGREIGRLAHAFGMHVIAITSPRRHVDLAPLTYQIADLIDAPGCEPDEIFTSDELHSVLPRCDFVVLVVPHTATSHHLFSTDEFIQMKASAYLINIARGGVVDEMALVTALQNGDIAGAALDVFAEEPLPPDSPLWDLDNAIISPHVAGFTSRYYECILDLFSQNIERYLSGDPLLNQVHP